MPYPAQFLAQFLAQFTGSSDLVGAVGAATGSASLTATRGGDITIASSAGEVVMAPAESQPSLAPADEQYPFGFLSFDVVGLTPGQSVERGEAMVQHAVELFRQVGTPYGIGLGLFGLADLKSRQGRHAEAIPLLDDAAGIYRKYPNRIGLWYTLNERSAQYQAMGKIGHAQADAEQAYAIAKDVNFPLYISSSDQRLAALAAAAGNFRHAYELTTEAGRMTAKATQERSSQRMVQLAQRYESESKQRQINELTRRNEQQQAELLERELQQRWMWTVLGGSLLMLSGAAWFLLRLRRSRRALQDQTGILQSILDSMGDGVSVADITGQLILVNPAGEAILGVGLVQSKSQQWPQVYGLFLPDRTTPYPSQALPLTRALGGESSDGVEMYVANSALPEGRWLSVTARPLRDEQGRLRGGVAVFSDVTARKQAEEQIRALNVSLEQRVLTRTAELRQQTRYLRTLIDMLPMWTWFKDTQSRYLALNRSYAQARGQTVDQMLGRTDADLLPPALADASRTDDAEVMQTQRHKTVEEAAGTGDGTVWMETYKAAVVDDDGTVLGTVGAARDISERKAAEAARESALAEAQRLARLRSDFLAQMSHELRTPLNAILGYAQILLRDRNAGERQVKGLTTIQDSGQHLLTLINDILDLSRIEAAKLELQPTDVDLGAFVRIVGDIIRVKADQRDLIFRCEVTPAQLPVVRVDDKRLRQVLINLLGNAVKFTDRGQVILRVSCTAQPGAEMPRVHVRFAVEDSGIGMSAGQLSRAFQPFEQVSGGRRREGGVGLGLPISRQLVRLMGGDIGVYSRPGAGSRFSFELDLPLAESGTVRTPVSGRSICGYRGPRKRLLVVDDIEQSRAMLADCLIAMGFDVAQAENGQQCLDLVAASAPDAILMDLMMPVMDGLEATRRIRATAAFARLPIIAVSASVSGKDETGSYQAGADAFISKPIDEDLLLETLGHLLGLEWQYENGIARPEEPPASEEGPMQAPDGPEMETLHRLARAGNMRDIREQAERIGRLDPRFAAFARRLRSLADGYQSKAIVALVERYRGSGSG